MGLSFSAALLVFLSAATRTGIIAPDLLLFLRLGSGGLDVCKLFQKAKVLTKLIQVMIGNIPLLQWLRRL